MSVLDTLAVDIFGIAIVFGVLIALSIVIKLISVIVGRLQEQKTDAAVADKTDISLKEQAHFADGELKLIDVDEKTAALIMAIVSDESQIPLSQLQFRSIRLMK